MLLKLPASDRKIVWTQHSKMKLKQYRFSEKRVLRIFRKPDRIEEGIAEGTIAVMQITGTKKHPSEAWLMYQIVKVKSQKSKTELPFMEAKVKKRTESSSSVKIISAWRYPGRTPKGERPIIPEDALEELCKIN